MDNYIDLNNSGDWTELAAPVVKSEEADRQEVTEGVENLDSNNKAKKSTPILTIQLVICLLFLTALFLLKSFDYADFSYIKNWYDSELTSKMHFKGDFRNLDYSSIFESTDDEI